MDKCDILLFQGDKFVSRLIRWGTKSAYSHVAVCVSGNEIIEAVCKGVRRLKAADLKGRLFDVYRVKEECDSDGVIRFLEKRIGSRYDFAGVAFLGLFKLLHIFGIRSLSNWWQKKQDYFCSELCYEAFDKGGGVDIVPDITSSDITSPADIAASRITEKISGDIEYNKRSLIAFDIVLYIFVLLLALVIIAAIIK